MALITTTLGDMDEALLVKSTGDVDNDTERTVWVEYCEKDCKGQAHFTGQASGPGVFCDRHIHRSVNMELKHGMLATGIAGEFT